MGKLTINIPLGIPKYVVLFLTIFPHSKKDCLLYALFVFYTAVFCWLITRLSFFKKAGIAGKWLIGLFLIRVIFGIINCYMSFHYFTITDSLVFHQLGLEEFDLLKHHPKEFFTNILYDPYQKQFSGLLETSNSYWNNLKTNALLKMLAVMDVFSFGNFFINTLFYNFLVFFGVVAIYRFFKKMFSSYPVILMLSVFLFPSALLFTSMIHRDGLIFLSIGILLLQMQRMFENGFSFKSTFFVILSMALIFILRNFVLFILIPSIVAWVLAQKKPKFSLVIFSLIFLFCGIFFFAAKKIIPAADFPKYVADRQHSFLELSKESTTRLPSSPLTVDFTSFLKEAPSAMKNAFFLPFISHSGIMELPFALELIIVEITFVLLLIFPKKGTKPAMHFIVFFSIVLLLMMGYTIPVLGAILRYRSIYLNFLFIAIICSINWPLLFKRINIIK